MKNEEKSDFNRKTLTSIPFGGPICIRGSVCLSLCKALCERAGVLVNIIRVISLGYIKYFQASGLLELIEVQ